jgi:hypothetical protein
MRRILFLFTLLSFLFSYSFSEEATSPYELYMADGQLMGHAIRVFVNTNVEDNVKLHFFVSHLKGNKDRTTAGPFEYKFIARDQNVTVSVDGQNVNRNGTLLLYDLYQFPMPIYSAMTRVTPILTWTDKNNVEQSVISDREIYISNGWGAIFWSIVLTFVCIGVILLIIFVQKEKIITLFCAANGQMSLSKVQMACWTIAVGGLVAGYSLIQLKVPDIPNSLVVLMGLSITTTGLIHLPGRKSIESVDIKKIEHPRISDIINNYNVETGEKYPSIVKAQMLFWTILLIVVFVAKSIIDGTLWSVPWELVALMGISQAGYVSPNLMSTSTIKEKESEKKPDTHSTSA